MNKRRPNTLLFMLQSVDGKISTGDVDERDVDKDFPKISGVREGLNQYYELEKSTDLVSFNTGKVQAKVGVNTRNLDIEQSNVSFVIVDSKPHLDQHGSEYLAKRSKSFYLITNNKNHPAFSLKSKYSNIEILLYEGEIDFIDAFRKLKADYSIDSMTIQSGGTMNAHLLRLGLIDRIAIVIAPCLVGGINTQSLVGGKSLHTGEDLIKIKGLKLISCEQLENSYLYVQYKVINDAKIA